MDYKVIAPDGSVMSVDEYMKTDHYSKKLVESLNNYMTPKREKELVDLFSKPDEEAERLKTKAQEYAFQGTMSSGSLNPTVRTARINAYRAGYHENVGPFKKEIERQQAQVGELQDVLRWYTNSDNFYLDCQIDADAKAGGQLMKITGRAKQALESVEYRTTREELVEGLEGALKWITEASKYVGPIKVQTKHGVDFHDLPQYIKELLEEAKK